MYWSYDHNSVTIRVEALLATSKDWFAIGFSDEGDINGSDMCILWTDTEFKFNLLDIHVDSDSMGYVDNHNDCHLLNASKVSNRLSFAFQRAFNTCDPIDYIIEDGTTNIVYVTGSQPLITRIDMNANIHGIRPIRLMDIPDHMAPDLKNATIYDFLQDNEPVQVNHNCWKCSVHLLPKEFHDKHHIIKYEPIIQSGNSELVHHIKLHVLKNPPLNEVKYLDCDNSTQYQYAQIVAWANGSKPYAYPEETGVAIGGESGPQYLLLDIHYHNMAQIPGLRDSSGLRLYVTNKLRKYDAGLLKIGMNHWSEYDNLPVNRTAVDLSVFVTSQCSLLAFPAQGITIFAQQLHTHQKRTRVWTQHVRNGTELTEFNRDNHCNHQYLDIWNLKHRVTVLPGDVLIHTCRYDTTKKPVAAEMMCSTFFHYYPATNIRWVVNEVQPYIDYMTQNLKYTPQELLDNRPPIVETCTQLNGQAYQGNWSDIPVPKIHTPLKHFNKECTLLGRAGSGHSQHTPESRYDLIRIIEKSMHNPIELSLLMGFVTIAVFLVLFSILQCMSRVERRADTMYAHRRPYTKRDINFEKFPNLLTTEGEKA